ncbi:MAG: PspC domain-containing protein [Clostridia bacterium]|nr:PspC domain-containing protein [Clostridia bacterium]MBQ9505629.1 PspC domain-containing protein [Clostridia bacterium]MBR5424570.1 PspC domain-containing protein [Clostridia bacterium]
MEKKKLYRSVTDRKIAGVCGGIAEYLNVDVTIVRLVAVLLALFASGGVWLYIICIFVIPEPPAAEGTGGNPYENTGEPV